MFESASPRAVFIALALIALLAGAALIQNGSKVVKNPSLDTPMISGSTRTFAGATLIFIASAVFVTWVLNPNF
jgi:hypothetical protein